MKKEPCNLPSLSEPICFNPCSNGMKKEPDLNVEMQQGVRFNPCSNGMKKEQVKATWQSAEVIVLILVLME